ncbi:hypothetical protein [Streptomyces sp. BK239]|uniref:hypothetical protein n=1 Tax=Streptomyces sp. BK239 TaxID=2512155 RepID=UPI001F5FAD4D|nr:hypothetical protein [Streptomyces sp. BK239]
MQVGPVDPTGGDEGVVADGGFGGFQKGSGASTRQNWAAAMTLIVFDESVEPTPVASLTKQPWDVVVVGGGIRKTEPLLPLFEQIVNLIRRHAPQAAIAFNTSGGDSVEAAQRWL